MPDQGCSCHECISGRGGCCYAYADIMVRPFLAATLNHECRERRAEARAALVQCLHGYPCNWAAWLALADVSGGAEFERASDPGQAR